VGQRGRDREGDADAEASESAGIQVRPYLQAGAREAQQVTPVGDPYGVRLQNLPERGEDAIRMHAAVSPGGGSAQTLGVLRRTPDMVLSQSPRPGRVQAPWLLCRIGERAERKRRRRQDLHLTPPVVS